MIETPKSLRLKIGIYGRTNAGKSSLINLITNQKVSIVSDIKGTTTDSVQKAMELFPIGPITIVDTPGLEDTSALKDERLKITTNNLKISDVAILVISDGLWKDEENFVYDICKEQNIPLLVILNKSDLQLNAQNALNAISQKQLPFLNISVKSLSQDNIQKEKFLNDFTKELLKLIPEDFVTPQTILGDLLPQKESPLVILITPIDLQAPKGRLILPQVQTIRDALDNEAIVTIVKENNYVPLLQKLNSKPDLVVCDSQCVKFVTENTPEEIPCTTFSILFSRLKGEMKTFAKGAAMLKKLSADSKVLIAEACTHHPTNEDIGRVKIPNMIHQKINSQIKIDYCAGKDFPENLSDYDLIIHCGGCMLTRREQLLRISEAQKHNVPITNYGMAISVMQNSITKVLSPFPKILNIFTDEANGESSDE